MPPYISVIIPTCGRPDLLLDCVASVLRNDYEDFEVIIVDQDPAATLEGLLARRFDGDRRLVYLWLDEQHLSRARNAGIRHARGRIIVFSDDDVEVDPGWLRAYVEAFDAGGAAPGVVGGRLDPLWLAPKPPWLPDDKAFMLGIYDRTAALAPMPDNELPIGANFAAHRDVIDTIGLFDERLGYSYARRQSMLGGEDSLFSMRARQARYPVLYQPAARAWHKMSPRKLSRRYFIRRSFWEGVTLLTVLHLSGRMHRRDAPRLVVWHLRELGRSWWRLLAGLTGMPGTEPRGQRVMDGLSRIANSAGVIRAAAKLWASARLP